MIDQRSKNPADLVMYWSDLIIEERRKLEECLANITHYAEQLRKVTYETRQRMLPKE